MATCFQCLNLVPRGKLCPVHQPSDVISQSGTNGHAKNARFSDHVSVLVLLESEAFKRQGLSIQCGTVYWWCHSWTSSGCVSSRLLQWLPMHSGLFSKVFLPSSSLFLHQNFSTHCHRGFNDPFFEQVKLEIGVWERTHWYFFIKPP